MKSLCLYLVIPGLILLAGCQKNLDWTRSDGSSPTPEQLQHARKVCRIDIKLAGLERAEEERDTNLSNASTEQAEMLVKGEYDLVKKQVYREIDTCMSKKGLKR
ncbi:MAG: hypothetical protein GY802_07085 [Gammaproteobacteria bacterium]|nr:hypothetical protein [Gammaproteobacteria bacterium]